MFTGFLEHCNQKIRIAQIRRKCKVWNALKAALVAPDDVPEVYICNIDFIGTTLQHPSASS